MVTFIIAEKPDAASHIAHALAEKGLKKKSSEFGVEYFEFDRNKKKHIVFRLQEVGKRYLNKPGYFSCNLLNNCSQTIRSSTACSSIFLNSFLANRIGISLPFTSYFLFIPYTLSHLFMLL